MDPVELAAEYPLAAGGIIGTAVSLERTARVYAGYKQLEKQYRETDEDVIRSLEIDAVKLGAKYSGLSDIFKGVIVNPREVGRFQAHNRFHNWDNNEYLDVLEDDSLSIEEKADQITELLEENE